MPQVRGATYSEIGSSGALTLISLAWYLAVFERSVELDGFHPGVLMIDSPQKNLRPRAGVPEDEYQSPAIPNAVYRHMTEWVQSEIDHPVQIIIVDNAPPDSALEYVIVDYSGSAERPPYGLIEDAVE